MQVIFGDRNQDSIGILGTLLEEGYLLGRGMKLFSNDWHALYSDLGSVNKDIYLCLSIYMCVYIYIHAHTHRDRKTERETQTDRERERRKCALLPGLRSWDHPSCKLQSLHCRQVYLCVCN